MFSQPRIAAMKPKREFSDEAGAPDWSKRSRVRLRRSTERSGSRKEGLLKKNYLLESRHVRRAALALSATETIGRAVRPRFFSSNPGKPRRLLFLRADRRRALCRKGQEPPETP